MGVVCCFLGLSTSVSVAFNLQETGYKHDKNIALYSLWRKIEFILETQANASSLSHANLNFLQKSIIEENLRLDVGTRIAVVLSRV